MVDIEQIQELDGIIKWRSIYRLAKLPDGRMRSKQYRGTELTVHEASAIQRVLNEHGIEIKEPKQ